MHKHLVYLTALLESFSKLYIVLPNLFCNLLTEVATISVLLIFTRSV